MNIRLTAEEHVYLESRSQAQGFRGLPDCMGAAALAGAAPTTTLTPERRARPRKVRKR